MIKATCSSCQRTFETNEAYVEAVRAGRLESLCSYCDGSHAIDEVEYQYEDR